MTKRVYNVTIKDGACIHHYRGRMLYAEWPDGMLTTLDGKRLTRAEADELLREAKKAAND